MKKIKEIEKIKLDFLGFLETDDMLAKTHGEKMDMLRYKINELIDTVNELNK